MAGINRMSDEWQSEAFRMSMVKRLEEAIQEHGLQGQKDPQTMEQQIFMRAKTREDYLNCIARFILMIQKNFSKLPRLMLLLILRNVFSRMRLMPN